MASIEVNYKKVEVDPADSITYEAVVTAAGYSPKRVLTVVWVARDPDPKVNGPHGSLCPGDSTRYREGMMFQVADTSNA